jgi:hypothetical protein
MTRSRDVADTQDNTGGAVAPFLAGKNKVINGDFGIWQRGTSFSSSLTYTADRFVGYSDASQSYSRQSFTPGTAPVAGYESQYFWRGTKGGTGTFISLYQLVEDVRTFAGQTVTISFWAKADSAQTIYVRPVQNFGTGGSTGVIVDTVAVSIGTSWSRVSATFTFPSIAGKTLGANNHILLENYILNNGSLNWDVWGYQAEVGRVATPFTTASNTIGGELALCQRYYWRSTPGGAYSPYGNGGTISSTGAYVSVPMPVQMRTSPASIDFSNIAMQTSGGTLAGLSSLTIDQGSPLAVSLAAITGSSWTANQPCRMINNNSSAGYVGFSAEL